MEVTTKVIYVLFFIKHGYTKSHVVLGSLWKICLQLIVSFKNRHHLRITEFFFRKQEDSPDLYSPLSD